MAFETAINASAPTAVLSSFPGAQILDLQVGTGLEARILLSFADIDEMQGLFRDFNLATLDLSSARRVPEPAPLLSILGGLTILLLWRLCRLGGLAS